MMILALLLAAAPPIAVIDRTLRVPGAEVRSLRVSIRNKPATLDVQFKVHSGNANVRLVVVAAADENRYGMGRPVDEIAASPFEHEGKLKFRLPTPGDYVLIVDNRPSLKTAALVSIHGTMAYDSIPLEAKYLSPMRRLIVIASSLVFFFGVVWFAGRRLWAATIGQKNSGPPDGYV